MLVPPARIVTLRRAGWHAASRARSDQHTAVPHANTVGPPHRSLSLAFSNSFLMMHPDARSIGIRTAHIISSPRSGQGPCNSRRYRARACSDTARDKAHILMHDFATPCDVDWRRQLNIFVGCFDARSRRSHGSVYMQSITSSIDALDIFAVSPVVSNLEQALVRTSLSCVVAIIASHTVDGAVNCRQTVSSSV